MNKNKYFNPHYNQRDYDLGDLKGYDLVDSYMKKKEEPKSTKSKTDIEEILNNYSRNKRIENTDRNDTIFKYSHWGGRPNTTLPMDIVDLLSKQNDLIHTLITATDIICFIQDEFIYNKDFKEKRLKKDIEYYINVILAYLAVSECSSMVAPKIISDIFPIESEEMTIDDFETDEIYTSCLPTISNLKESIDILKVELNRCKIALNSVDSEWVISYNNGVIYKEIMKEGEKYNATGCIVNRFKFDILGDNISEIAIRINWCISITKHVSGIMEEY